MEWGRLNRVIWRNALHPNAVLLVKQDGPHVPKDMISIFDLNRARRHAEVGVTNAKGLISTKEGNYADTMRDAQVCNAAWINGQIPRRWKGDDAPKRGWQQLLEVMLGAGTLRPSRELDELLELDTRSLVPDDMRIMYVA